MIVPGAHPVLLFGRQMRDTRWNRAHAQMERALRLWHYDTAALLVYNEQAIEVCDGVMLRLRLRMAAGLHG